MLLLQSPLSLVIPLNRHLPPFVDMSANLTSLRGMLLLQSPLSLVIPLNRHLPPFVDMSADLTSFMRDACVAITSIASDTPELSSSSFC